MVRWRENVDLITPNAAAGNNDPLPQAAITSHADHLATLQRLFLVPLKNLNIN